MNPHPIAHSQNAMGLSELSYSEYHGSVHIVGLASKGHLQHLAPFFHPEHIAFVLKA